MSNPDDVTLFEQGVDAWNAAIEQRLYGRHRERREALLAADLSGEHFGIRAHRRWNLDGTTLDTLVSYPRAEFGACDLRGANFGLVGIGFDFRAANFGSAKLQGTNFYGADLQGAKFPYANLQGTVLTGARLDGARLDNADLTGADLSYAAPWRAHLFNRELSPDPPIEPKNTAIRSVSDLIGLCDDLRKQTADSAFRFYFRGEVRSWKLRPSVLRSLWLRKAEGRMLTELMTRRPHDFGDVELAVEQWVLAQHHGLKTRFLDVTRNPLVALFFACEASHGIDADSRLHVFAVPPALVKPYDSDSISIVANFAKLSFGEQSTLLGKRRENTGSYERAMGKLYHLIGLEKPHFRERIDPRDLFRVFVVEPRNSFERINAQAGAFFLSAFHERFEQGIISRYPCRTPVYEHFTWTIPNAAKPKIIDELKMLNITRDALFASLTEAARAITAQHGRPQAPDKHARWVGLSPWDYPERPLPPDRLPRILELGRLRAESHDSSPTADNPDEPSSHRC